MVIIERLDKALATALGESILAIDRALWERLGDGYSHECWVLDNVLMDVPGKWAHSYVALDAGGHGAVGFWIASLPEPGRLHTHRVGVEPSRQGQGIGHLLYWQIAERARESGITRMTLTVGAANAGAQQFYASLGFVRMRGIALQAFARGRVDTVCDGDSIVVSGHRYYALDVTWEGYV